jgi:hypothetical protein
VFGKNERYENEKLRIQKQNLDEQRFYNRETIKLREREIKEQERVKTLEYKIIKENEELKKELDLYKSYFEFFKSALFDTEVFTGMYFDTDYGDSRQFLNLEFKAEDNSRGQIRLDKRSLTLILMQKLGRDVMKPFEYAYQVLKKFFTLTQEQNAQYYRLNPKYEALLNADGQVQGRVR